MMKLYHYHIRRFTQTLAFGMLITTLASCQPSNPQASEADNVSTSPQTPIEASDPSEDVPLTLELTGHAIRLEPDEITYAVTITNRTSESADDLVVEFTIPDSSHKLTLMGTPEGTITEATPGRVSWKIASVSPETILGPFAVRETGLTRGAQTTLTLHRAGSSSNEVRFQIESVEEAASSEAVVAMAEGPITDIPGTGIRYTVMQGDRGMVSVARTSDQPSAGVAGDLTWIASYHITKENPGSALFEVPLVQPAPPYSLVRVFVDEGAGYFEQMSMGMVSSDGLHATLPADGSSTYVLGVDTAHFGGGTTSAGSASGITALEGVVDDTAMLDAAAQQMVLMGYLGIDILSLVGDSAGTTQDIWGWSGNGHFYELGGDLGLFLGTEANCGDGQATGATLSGGGASFTSCSNGTTVFCTEPGSCTTVDPNSWRTSQERDGLFPGPGCGSLFCFSPSLSGDSPNAGSAGGDGGFTVGGTATGIAPESLSNIPLAVREYMSAVDNLILMELGIPPPTTSTNQLAFFCNQPEHEGSPLCSDDEPDEDPFRGVFAFSGDLVVMILPGGQAMDVALSPSPDLLLPPYSGPVSLPPTPDPCGDGVCDPITETHATCATDCPGICSDACTDSSQCAAGLSCFNGVCWEACTCGGDCGTSSGGGGAQECKTSAQCSGGEKCVGGVCVSP